MTPHNPSTEIERVLEARDTYQIPAGIAHMVTGIENSPAIEFRDSEYEKIDYPPYRKIVGEYLSI